MKNLLTTLIILLLLSCTKQNSEKEDVMAIRNILQQQQEAWSNHDLEGFMQGYWKSDSLTYFSRGKITQGWQTTLDNYKKGYPTPAETGELNFRIANITKIDADAYWVMGEYFLSREVGDANGTFMIIFKKIDGIWKIVGDSSC
ncbi:MAG: nuclear transport factor 2 family protein [Flavobacteriales bacterium]|nr:MAG: nuclear transport factor 2 family protein [Flavobacteriales bacterium]